MTQKSLPIGEFSMGGYRPYGVTDPEERCSILMLKSSSIFSHLKKAVIIYRVISLIRNNIERSTLSIQCCIVRIRGCRGPSPNPFRFRGESNSPDLPSIPETDNLANLSIRRNQSHMNKQIEVLIFIFYFTF